MILRALTLLLPLVAAAGPLPAQPAAPLSPRVELDNLRAALEGGLGRTIG